MKTRPVDRSHFLLYLLSIFLLAGCLDIRPSSGGGKANFTPPRKINPSDVALPQGYRIEAVATGLTFPSGVAFDESGRAYIVETGYSYGEKWTTPRLLRIEPDGKASVIASGGKNGPWNGVTYHQGAFYVAEGGEQEGGRILKITPDGKITPLVEGLPSLGDHHTNGPVIGPDGMLYFAQGTATNSAVVGEDNKKFGWLPRHPEFHDIPCKDVTLNGENYKSLNLLKADSKEEVETGAFSPFGVKTSKGQVIKGQVPCSGSVMKVPIDGGSPELVAWGFRNPFALAFSPDSRLFVTENSYDDRGSRPIHGTGDLLWEIKPGIWYGWPDFHGQRPVDEGDHHKSLTKGRQKRLLASLPNDPPKPAAILEVHSSSNGFDFSRNAAFGYIGHVFIAQFGDMAPDVGKVFGPVGFKVVRVDVTEGVIHDFATNKGKANGPGSWIGTSGFERPVAARFDPLGTALYVVDFGVMTIGEKGPDAREETGVLWKITKEGGQ